MVRCVFFGTPSLAADILDALVDRGVEVVGVVTQPDKPQGRGGRMASSPVKILTQNRLPQVPLFQPVKAHDAAFISQIAELRPDLFLVAAYGQIMRETLLQIPRLGSVNVHTSLLPRYRGAAPIQRCLIEGEARTGVSLMYMVREMDAGDVISTAELSIPPQMNAGELEENLGKLGARLLLEALPALEAGQAKGTPQDTSQVTFAPKVQVEEARLVWERSAQQLHNLVRGCTPKPGAWAFVRVRGEMKRLKVLRTEVCPQINGQPGQILTYGKEGLVVACGQGALRLCQVQLEGKKAMSGEAFCLGVPKDALTIPLHEL